MGLRHKASGTVSHSAFRKLSAADVAAKEVATTFSAGKAGYYYSCVNAWESNVVYLVLEKLSNHHML